MGRKEQRRKGRRESTGGTVRAKLGMFAPLTSAFCLLLVIAVAVFGLERLKDRVYARPEYQPAIRIELDVAPEDKWVIDEGWGPRVLSAIKLRADQGWMDESLCETIGKQVLDSGWVSDVDRVIKQMDGTIRVSCAFRRPVAMVLIDGMYVAVDKSGYRLPGLYPDVSDAGWIRLVGVRSSEPEVGKAFTSDDALAGIELAFLLSQQGFASRVDTVDVSNFGGRLRPGRGHMKVLSKCGKVFNWGSPIREEFDENSCEQKLRLMHRQLANGPARGEIDLTVYSNAVIQREVGDVPASEGLADRGG